MTQQLDMAKKTSHATIVPKLTEIQIPHETPQTDRKSEWAGYLAMMLSITAFGYQIGRNDKVKKQKDVSLEGWITSVGVDGAWAAYGLTNGLMSVAISNGLALIPRVYGVYQIARGYVDNFKTATRIVMSETLSCVTKMMERGRTMAESWMWAAVGDPINTLVAAAMVPVYLQFRKTMRETETHGLSLVSQSAYALASVAWGVNGYLFGKGTVVAASVIGLYFYAAVTYAKLKQMKQRGENIGAGAWQETVDTAKFTYEKMTGWANRTRKQE